MRRKRLQMEDMARRTLLAALIVVGVIVLSTRTRLKRTCRAVLFAAKDAEA